MINEIEVTEVTEITDEQLEGSVLAAGACHCYNYTMSVTH